jgi:two-component system LytT family response regulator
MRCILIDDERHCLENLELLVTRYCPELEIIAACQGGQAGLKAIQDHAPDLVFLDIAMPGMDGFQLLSSLDTHPFQLIFTTAFNEYAIDAFKVHAIDYLLKPVDRGELIAAVERATEMAELSKVRQAGDRLNDLLQRVSKESHKGQISIPTAEGLEIIQTSGILYCLGEGNYTTLYLENGNTRIVSKNLKFLEEKLSGNPHFFRVHHSAIIQLGKVREYVRGKGGYVVMTDNRSIRVSRQRKQLLMEALG